MGQIRHLRTIQRSFTPNSATPFIARFAPLGTTQRESQFLNSRLRLRIELSADSCKSYVGEACNSLNSFSSHVDR
jgi:hypothetical protein